DTASNALSAVVVSGPGHAASFGLNAGGAFTYTPAANYNGSDSFTYKVTGGGPDSNTATVSLTINAVNDAPVNSAPATQTVNEDTDLVFSIANSNAITISDVDAGNSAVKLSLDVLDGTLTLASTSGLTFVNSTS